jgi:uncharacterized membrane protein (UPF0127 family)
MGVRRLFVNDVDSGCDIRVADTWWRRAIGQLGTREFAKPDGLWIAPCGSVHTMAMRYAIDVVYVSRDGRLLRIVDSLRPWRMSACARAQATLELPSGVARELRLAPGDKLRLATSA